MFIIRSTSYGVVIIRLCKTVLDQTIDKRDQINKHPDNIPNWLAKLRKLGCEFTCEIYDLLITGTRFCCDRYCGGD